MERQDILKTIRGWYSLFMYDEEDERRVARVLLGLISIYQLTSIMIIALGILWGDTSMITALFIGSVAMLIPLVLLLRGNLSASSDITILLFILFVTIFASLGYGIRDYTILGYPVAIVFAGLSKQRRGLIFAALLSLLSMAWLVFGEREGYFVVPVIYAPTWFDYLLIAQGILLIAVEVNLLVANLKVWLEQLNRELRERRKVEEALRASQDVIQNINNNLVSGMIYQVLRMKDGKRKFTYLSDGVVPLYGATPSQVIEDPDLIYNKIHPQDMPRLYREEEEANRMLTVFRTRTRVINPDGSVRWSSFISNPKLLEDGTTRWDGIELDITEQMQAEETLHMANQQLSEQLVEIRQLQEELREQALRDPLTGLYNRRYLDEVLTHEVSRAERELKPFSLIMLDIDLFKKINDTHGHPVGDLFLVAIANLLKSHVRGMDTACRYGGEEFLLVLPGAEADDAFKRSEEIRLQCNEIIVMNEGEPLRVNISLGIATYPIHGKTANDLLIKADKALYISKRNGRNATTIWPGHME